MQSKKTHKVSIVMGSQSDFKTMKLCQKEYSKYHEIKYEDIVSNFDLSIKKILRFLDLDWSDAVLDFYKTAEKRKLISTPSYDQVNKPIYSKSVFKWKNYEKNLSEIIPTLKPWFLLEKRNLRDL